MVVTAPSVSEARTRLCPLVAKTYRNPRALGMGNAVSSPPDASRRAFALLKYLGRKLSHLLLTAEKRQVFCSAQGFFDVLVPCVRFTEVGLGAAVSAYTLQLVMQHMSKRPDKVHYPHKATVVCVGVHPHVLTCWGACSRA